MEVVHRVLEIFSISVAKFYLLNSLEIPKCALSLFHIMAAVTVITAIHALSEDQYVFRIERFGDIQWMSSLQRYFWVLSQLWDNQVVFSLVLILFTLFFNRQ